MTQSVVAAESSHNPDDLLKQSERYPDLRAAGRKLALQLESFRGVPDLLVLGIALGGLPVAHEVATHLGAQLDFVLIQRLLTSNEPGSQICAVNVAGLLVTGDEIELSDRPSSPLEHFLAEAIGGLEKREKTCRRGLAPVAVAGRNVILVDCGIRTGSTIKVAVSALRSLDPRKIIAAVPVASAEGYELAQGLADEIVCLARPKTFVNAGFWYRDFRRPGDEAVGDLL